MTMRRAFTLVEILIVIVLLGLMAAVAIPAFPHPPPLIPASAAADTIASLLDAVHHRAVDRGTTMVVLFDPATAHYWVRPSHPAGTDTAVDGVLTLPDGVTLAGPLRARFTFDPTGTASGDRITMTDALGHVAVVTVDPWTGAADHGQPR
jgi:prepilin-type N-terminal cleavage/methylation domain-containing protein